MSTPMENQGKSPKELLAEFERDIQPMMKTHSVYLNPSWLLSSLSDLLRWSAEQMPNNGTRCPHACTMCDSSTSASKAIDDCKATLLRLADEIWQLQSK